MLFCGKGIKTIAITSCNENDGKSTISSELAKSLSEAGYRTLLIDADMRKSVLIKGKIAAKMIEGLSEQLSGMCEKEDIIYKTQHEKFDVIFAGRFPPSPVELIGNGRFEQLLKELKEEYDYIIIDTPPLGIVIDAAVISSYCDGAMLVLAAGKTSRKLAVDVKKQLEQSGCKLLGAIVNEVKKPNKFYKNEYKSKYYAEYK